MPVYSQHEKHTRYNRIICSFGVACYKEFNVNIAVLNTRLYVAMCEINLCQNILLLRLKFYPKSSLLSVDPIYLV